MTNQIHDFFASFDFKRKESQEKKTKIQRKQHEKCNKKRRGNRSSAAEKFNSILGREACLMAYVQVLKLCT